VRQYVIVVIIVCLFVWGLDGLFTELSSVHSNLVKILSGAN
jgi:hypothetical protein